MVSPRLVHAGVRFNPEASVERIDDCLAPREIDDAIFEGAKATRSLGW
jgi:hypothetical protein